MDEPRYKCDTTLIFTDPGPHVWVVSHTNLAVTERLALEIKNHPERAAEITSQWFKRNKMRIPLRSTIHTLVKDETLGWVSDSLEVNMAPKEWTNKTKPPVLLGIKDETLRDASLSEDFTDISSVV